jgi:glycosyltransferase involved in cell wall biosynthesis
VVVLESNQGKGEAVRTGMRQALAAGADAVGYLDADLSTPLDEVPRFLERLFGDPRLVGVLGSRVNLLGHEIERRRLRHAAGRVFASGAVLALGFPVYDTLRSALDEPFGSRWSFDVELIARIASLAGPESMLEMPVLSWRDVAGSKVRFWHSFSALFDLLRIRRKYR